eukprot:jgi/Chlat1/6691/Chrsp49S06136
MPPRPQPARKAPDTNAASSSRTSTAPPRPAPATTTSTTTRRTSRTTPTTTPSTTTAPATRSTSTSASIARNVSRAGSEDKPNTTSAGAPKPRPMRSSSTLNSASKPRNTNTNTNSSTRPTSFGPDSLASDLPPDALFQVFRWLSPRDVASAACACSTWAAAGRSEALWKALYSSRWGDKSNPTTTTTVTLSSLWQDRFRDRWVRDAQARVDRALRRLCKVSIVAKQQHNNVYNIAPGQSRRAIDMLDVTHTLAGEGFGHKSKGSVSGFPQSQLIRLNVDGNLIVKSLRSLKVASYSRVTENAFTALCADVGMTAAWTRVASGAGGMTLWQLPAGAGSAVFMGVFVDTADDHDEDGKNNNKQQRIEPNAQTNSSASGLHGYFLSVQLRMLGKLLWHENFPDLHFDKDASVARNAAVFPLITNAKACSGQVIHFLGSLSLPWRTDAFSGSLTNVVVAEISLWSESGAWVSHGSRAIMARPAERPCLRYDDFDGEVRYSEARVVSGEGGVRVEFGFVEGKRRGEAGVMVEKMEMVLEREWLREHCGCIRF